MLGTSSYAAGALLRDVDQDLASELESIQYSSTATVNVALRRADVAHPLDGFGFVTPAVERRAILACSFSSIKFAERAPAGHVLLRAFIGGALQPEMFARDDADITNAVIKDLRDLLGLRHQPLFTHLERWPRSMAQYHVGHLAKIAGIRERMSCLPGLALAGNAYAGAGIPDCIRSGQQAIEKLRTQEFREAL
ncbi:MAG: protoporphyrinogen oxidase [Pyrinomonadaceae bacterium]